MTCEACLLYNVCKDENGNTDFFDPLNDALTHFSVEDESFKFESGGDFCKKKYAKLDIALNLIGETAGELLEGTPEEKAQASKLFDIQRTLCGIIEKTEREGLNE